MRIQAKRSIAIAFAVMFVLSLTTVFPAYATNGAKVFVDPASIITDTVHGILRVYDSGERNHCKHDWPRWS